MAVSVKTREKRHAAIKKGWRAHVPEFNILDYKSSLLNYLQYFNLEVENKDKQALVLDYWKKTGKDITGFSKISDGQFSQCAVVVYMIENNIDVDKNELNYLENKYNYFKDKYSNVEPTKAVVKKAAKVETDLDRAKIIGAEFDYELSKAFDAKGKYTFDFKDFLIKSNASPAVSKIVAGFYSTQLDELIKATKEQQYEEAYSFLGKVGLKRMTEFVVSMIDSCLTASQIKKTTRKPRMKKEKPAAVVAGKVKYLKEYSDLKLKSVTPDKVVGSSEVWLFNIKYRKLFKYVALDGMKLTFKGTTLQNFDPEKSGAKTIRKPETYFPELINRGKRDWNKAFNDVKSVLAKATGRINEEVLILGVF